MKIELPLEKMSVSEKLSAIEYIWDDICRDKTDSFHPPTWHKDVLEAREECIKNGDGKFSDLAEVKKRLQI